MLTHTTFVAEIDAFLERSGMSPTAFGLGAVRDPNFVADVRNGRMPSLRTVEKVDEFIRSQEEPAEQPAGAN